MFDIIYRSCTRVNCVHEGNRPYESSKSEVTLCCLQSLLNQVTDNITIHVLDDSSLDKDVVAMKSLLQAYGARHQFISIDVRDNGRSMQKTFEYARDNKFELTYFCEDDYLHLPHALKNMLSFYHSCSFDPIIFPADEPDRYFRDKPYPSRIYLGQDCHWRTVEHTTGTFMISKKILNKYWKYYMKFADRNKDGEAGGEDQTINKIYRKEMCVSPIPSLAAHLNPALELPRFIDWERYFNSIKEALSAQHVI